eukprot:scaffold80416_cov42-Phaeocystis_antarctica.AAC.1
MAGVGVPVPMDDGTVIAAAPEIVCPLPGVARSGQKGRRFFAGNPPRPICPNWWGVGNRCLCLGPHRNMHMRNFAWLRQFW